jgi:hypothetical protein
MNAWVIPALYPKNPWIFGLSVPSAQLLMWGVSVFARLRGQ